MSYLSIALCIALWPAVCNGLAIAVTEIACASSVLRRLQQFVVSERDNECACAHNYKMASYATDSSCSVLEELGFEVVKTPCVRGSAPGFKRQFHAKTTVSNTRTNLE